MKGVGGQKRINKEIKDKVDLMSGGDTRQSAWFLRYMETGDAVASVKEVYPNSKYPSSQASYNVKKFWPIILENAMIRRASIEPLALRVLEAAMKESHMIPLIGRDERGNSIIMTDPHGDPVMVADAKILGVKVKAASDVLDRGMMPKGMAIHGLNGDPTSGAVPKGWKVLLDELVLTLGGAAGVKEIPIVKDRREYREYLDEKYPAPKMIEATRSDLQTKPEVIE